MIRPLLGPHQNILIEIVSNIEQLDNGLVVNSAHHGLVGQL